LESDVDGLRDNVNTLKELYDSVSDSLVEAFNTANESIEESISKVEHMTSVVEAFYNLVDLAGKDALGIDNSVLAAMRQTQFDLATD
jgi:archaellum component FlaC